MMKVRVSIAIAALVTAVIWSMNSSLLFGPSILLSGAEARVHDIGGAKAVSVSLTISNPDGPDRLLQAEAPDTKLATLQNAPAPDGLPIPANSTPVLALDGAYIMLMGVQGELTEGRLFPLTLIFENSGRVRTKARLIEAGDAMTPNKPHGHGGVVQDPPPRIELLVTPEGDGWRVRVNTANFTFTPEKMDSPHSPREGHAHLYLGGLKIMRMRGPEAVIGRLPPGPHQLRVTLNTNDHRSYMGPDGPVFAEATIDAP